MSEKPIPDITLTSFIQYVARRTPIAKINHVKRVKAMYEAEFKQGVDAYRRLRRRIGAARGTELDVDAAIDEALDRDKESYALLAKNHNKILTVVGGEYVKPRQMSWSHNELNVKLNPELAFRNEDVTTLYKLHLTQVALHKENLDVIFQMLAESISEDDSENAVIADLRRGRIFVIPPKVPDPIMGLALRLDADQFVKTWHAV